MNPYQYRASLHLNHPSATPDAITNALGLQPARVHSAGEPRTNPAGTVLKGVYNDTYLGAYLDDDKLQNSETTELDDYLFLIADRLEPSKEFIRSFVESGGQIELRVGLFCPQNSGFLFPWNLLDRMASLRVGLSLDYYPGSPNSTS